MLMDVPSVANVVTEFQNAIFDDKLLKQGTGDKTAKAPIFPASLGMLNYSDSLG